MQKEPGQFFGRVRDSMKIEDRGSFDQVAGIKAKEAV